MSTETLLITGQYTPPSGSPIGFEIHTTGKNATDNKLILLSKVSSEFTKVKQTRNGLALVIVASSFEYFKDHVLDKEGVLVYDAEVPLNVNIPGIWMCDHYIPPSPGTPIGFEIHTGKNATDNKFIQLSKYSPEIAKVYSDSKGRELHITPESFESFKEKILDKNVPWNPVVAHTVSIPGTWQSNNNIVASYYIGGSRKPKRNRLSTRRKLNKRRRSRRNVNRKNKKN